MPDELEIALEDLVQSILLNAEHTAYLARKLGELTAERPSWQVQQKLYGLAVDADKLVERVEAVAVWVDRAR